jgi:mRNA-degrading endonuclease YafQ of YafQ-DinJ toxin-antitoxin module
MITVGYSQEFVRLYDNLPSILKEEVKTKIALFKDRENHSQLKVHKLHGKYAHLWSFSVNYSHRIIFEYIGKGKLHVLFHTVGDHSIYD